MKNFCKILRAMTSKNCKKFQKLETVYENDFFN